MLYMHSDTQSDSALRHLCNTISRRHCGIGDKDVGRTLRSFVCG